MAPDQLLELELRREFLDHRNQLAGRASAVGCRGQSFGQALSRDGAAEEIGSSGADRVERDRHCVAIGEDDHRQRRPARAQRIDDPGGVVGVPAGEQRDPHLGPIRSAQDGESGVEAVGADHRPPGA